MGPAGNSLDQADQILEVVVGREVVFISKQIVSHTVVARVHKDIDIIAAGGCFHQSLGVAGLEAGAVRRNDEGIHIHANLAGPTDKMPVHQLAKFLCAGAGQQSQVGNRGFLGKEVTRTKSLFSHNSCSFIQLFFVMNAAHSRTE